MTSPNLPKSENQDKCKLLKSQIYRLQQQFPNEFDSFWRKKNTLQKRTNQSLYENLLEKSELFSRRAIIFDIHWTLWTEWEKKEESIEFQCKYGLNINIKNLNSFLDFCAIHGFIPLIDKIIINENNISNIKELYFLFEFALLNWDPLLANSLANEIKKLEENSQPLARQILEMIQYITTYTTSTYQRLYWWELQKIKNKWCLSENIFVEIAIRLENEIREKTNIHSSYMKLAGYEQDTKEKTDMHFLIKKTEKQNFNTIPLQFTISDSDHSWFRKKREAVEKYLLEKIKNWVPLSNNFIILSVNWAFRESFSDQALKQNKLGDIYREWIDSPWEREKTHSSDSSKFPLFIDTINPEIIQPAEIMYIALHLLYKKYNFRNSNKSKYLESCREIGKIDSKNQNIIHNIILSHIKIDSAEVKHLDDQESKSKKHLLLKHEYNIYYHGNHIGTIIIYGI